MATVSRKSDRKAAGTPPAVEYHEEYYPVQAFSWIGKSGSAATDFPHCGDADFDEIEDAGIAGLDMSTSGASAYLVWRAPQQMNVTENLSVQLAYTSTATPEQTTNSASGKVAWALSLAKLGEGREMSGLSYSTPSENGVDFTEIDYSGNTAYSGQAKLMTSTWAEISGYVNGAAESGTNLKHGDLVVFKFSRAPGTAGATLIPVSLIGATVRYQRDRL